MPNPSSGGIATVGHQRRVNGAGKNKGTEGQKPAVISGASKSKPLLERPGGWRLKVPQGSIAEIEKALGDSWRFADRCPEKPKENVWNRPVIDFPADGIRVAAIVHGKVEDRKDDALVTYFETSGFPTGEAAINLISSKFTKLFGAAVAVGLWNEYIERRKSWDSILEGWLYRRNEISRVACVGDLLQRPGSGGSCFPVFNRNSDGEWERRFQPTTRPWWYDQTGIIMMVPGIIPIS